MKTLFIILFVFLSDSSLNLLYSQQLTWSRIYGDTGAVSEQGIDIQQTKDGGYIVLSLKCFNQNYSHVQLLKLNSHGELIWEKTFEDSAIGNIPCSIQQTNDSGFIITGINGNAFLLKADKHGNQQWLKYYDSDYPKTYSSQVKLTDDNGYIFCGSVNFYDPPSTKGYLVKTDSMGIIVWQKLYTDSLFAGYSQFILSEDSKSYYMAGGTHSISQPLTTYTVVRKVDLNGENIWVKTYAANSEGASILQIDASALIINSRSTISSLGDPYIRIDTSGNQIWINRFSDPNISNIPVMICKDRNNNVQKVGSINSNVAYTEISPSGSQMALRAFNTTGFYATYGNIIKNTSDNGFIIVGTSTMGPETNQKNDLLVFKTDSNVIAPSLVKINDPGVILPEFELKQNFPNPFNPSTNIEFSISKPAKIEIKIYDINGRAIEKLKDEFLGSGNYRVEFNGMTLSSGIYFYEMRVDDKFVDSKRMILIK